MGEQALDRSGVFRRARLDAQDVFAAFAVHAHPTQDMVRAEALAVNVDRQDGDCVPAFLAQRFQLLGAGLDRFAG